MNENSNSVPTPKSDVRWFSYKVAEISSQTPEVEVRQYLHSLISALSQIQDTTFEPAVQAWRLVKSTLYELNSDIEEEIQKYLSEFPGLAVWHSTSPAPTASKSFATINAELRAQIKIAKLNHDFPKVRELTLKLLQNISGNYQDQRQDAVRQIAGTYLSIDHILALDIDSLRLCYQDFSKLLQNNERLWRSNDAQKARESFIRLAETFHSEDMDSFNQMAGCLRDFDRPDLALQVLDYQFPQLGKYVNPYFENTLLAVLLDLEEWDRSEILVKRLMNTGPVVVENRAKLLPTIWRFYKEMFVHTGDYDYFYQAENIVRLMPEAGVDPETISWCLRAMASVSGEQVSEQSDTPDAQSREPRKRAPSVERQIKQSGIESDLEAWFSQLPD